MNKDEYYKRLEQAINFIETNLNEDFTLTDVSKNAFSSLSHFHRIFYFMTGYSLKEYIRARRLSCAAMELISTSKSILEIALHAQFENAETFNKAFKKMFYESPSEFRKQKKEFNVVRKLHLQRNEVQALPQNMTLNFVFLPQQIVQGLKIHTTLENKQQTKDIPNFFMDVMQEKRLAAIRHNNAQKIFGIYSNMTDEEEFDFTLGLLVNENSTLQEPYSLHILPASQYACFTVRGDPSQLEAAWQYIYGIWMPNSGKDRQAGLDFEIYYPDKIEIYIPMQHDTK